MSILRSSRSVRASVGLMVALLLAPVFPAVAGPGDDVALTDAVEVCFSVVNPVGWPLEGVRFIALRLTGTIGQTFEAESDKNGFVRVAVTRSSYTFRVVDDEPAVSPLRNGAVYHPPADITNAGETVSFNAAGGTTPNACGAGQPGFAWKNGLVRMVGPSQQGYVEVIVNDSATGGARLPGAIVTGLAVQDDGPAQIPQVSADPKVGPLSPSAGARTDVDGVARLACPATRTLGVVVAKEAFIQNATSYVCSTSVASAAPKAWVDLWRAPVMWEVTVNDETGAVPAPTWVNVTSRPLDIGTRPGLCPMTEFGSTLDVRTMPLLSPDSGVPVVSPTSTPYLCGAGTDLLGRAVLLVPWSTDPTSEYGYAVTSAGYAVYNNHHGFGADDVLRASPGTKLPLHQDKVVLLRAPVTVGGTIVDVRGAPVFAANISFNQSSALKAWAETGTNGIFSVTLDTGTYDVQVMHDSKQKRTCTAAVGINAAGAGTLALTPADCLTLVAAGKAGLKGSVQDAVKLLPIPGLQVCTGPTGTPTCDTTTSTGTFVLEVAASTAISSTILRTQSNQPWTVIDLSGTGNTPAAGAVKDIGARNVLRREATITVSVTSAAGPFPDADVHVHRGALAVHVPTPSGPNKTLADGNYVLLPTTHDTMWTQHSTLSQFNIDPYVARAWKHRGSGTNDTLYAKVASGATHIDAAQTSVTIPILLDEINNAFSVAVVARDAHSGAAPPVDIAPAVRALVFPYTGGTPSGVGPISANATSSTSTLHLYQELGPYRICPNANSHYQAAGNGDTAKCVDGVVPGVTSLVTVPVHRNTVAVTFRGEDAHTGWAIDSFTASMTNKLNAFTCAPPGSTGFVCGAQTTAGTGTNTFTVPWTTGANDLCIDGAAQGYVVMPPGTAHTALGEQTAMLNATLCQAWELGSTPSVVVRPLRAPSPNPLAGSARLADGTAAPGTKLTGATDRPGFLCSPSVHHSGTSPYAAGCDTVAATNGGYSLAVPTTGANTTWNVTASLASHYDSWYDLWFNLTGLRGDFVMLPLAFSVQVVVTDLSPGLVQHNCRETRDFPVNVGLKDLRDGRPGFTATHHGQAYPQADGTCVGTIGVSDWLRDHRALPVAASGVPRPSPTIPFLVFSDHEEHAGYAFALAGPGSRTAAVTMTHFSVADTLTPPTAGHVLTGRVTDADLIAGAAAASGVPSRVSATTADPECGVSTITDDDGSYSLPVPCAGTYTIVVTPLVAALWKPKTDTATIPAGAGTTTKNFGVSRETGTITITVYGLGTQRPVPNALVAPDGVEVTAIPAPARTDALGQVVFASIPWGAYDVKIQGRQTPPLFVRPGPSAATTVYG